MLPVHTPGRIFLVGSSGSPLCMRQHECQDLPDRPWIGDERDEPDVAGTGRARRSTKQSFDLFDEDPHEGRDCVGPGSLGQAGPSMAPAACFLRGVMPRSRRRGKPIGRLTQV